MQKKVKKICKGFKVPWLKVNEKHNNMNILILPISFKIKEF